MPNVKSARSRIDDIDTQILELLTQRMRLARDVGIAKAGEARGTGKKLSILAYEREESIYRRLHRLADEHRLPWPLVQAVYTDIISLCRAAQGQVTAHVLGPTGTHSEWAARARFGKAVALQFHDSIPRAIKVAEQAVGAGDSNAVAVVPIENSLEGSVSATIDSLLSTSLKLVGEGYYRVRHALLSRSKHRGEIDTIYSHPMGIAQCQRWLQENLPRAKLVEVSSTAEAARHVSAKSSPKTTAAIASPYLAAPGLHLLANDIQDSTENITRFGVLGATVPGSSGDDKTSLVFSLPNKSGSLSESIDVFSRNKINMTKIESRPHKGLQWEYLFYVDLDGHAFDPRITKALEQFDTKVRYFKILGTYPKGRQWN